MSTSKQKEAARKNIAKAREVQSERAQGAKIPKQSEGIEHRGEGPAAGQGFRLPEGAQGAAD